MQFKVVSLVGGCSTVKSSMGYQFIEEGSKLSAKTAFRTFGGVSDVKAPDIKGAFYTAPDFKCRCGNTHLYQCKDCGKFICYDGKAQSNAVCPACNAKNDVPAAPADGRIVCSGSAGASKADIVLAIDISGSMSGDRLETVKKAAIEQFISKYKGSRMALVTFGDTVVVAEPPTYDLSVIENGKGESWDMWKNIAAQAPNGEFGNPDKFCSDIDKTNWMSATIEVSDENIIKHIINICIVFVNSIMSYYIITIAIITIEIPLIPFTG